MGLADYCGDGYGYDAGRHFGSGCGECYSRGCNGGSGYGCGRGYGYNEDYGDGYGDGYGYGGSDMAGDGSGYSYMCRCEHGEGSGCGKGCGFNDGSGSGASNSYGDSYADGCGSGVMSAKTLIIPKSHAWDVYHYVRVCDGKYILRNNREVNVGEELYEPSIKMCVCGLHASLSPEDAAKYAPPNSALTKVKVWGKLRVGVDKLVATNRKIVEIIK